MARSKRREPSNISLSPQPGRPRRTRLAWAVGACLTVALVVTAAANRRRFVLRCEDGALVAYRGLPLPAGEQRLDPALYPPVPVPAAQCLGRELSSRRALDDTLFSLRLARIDDALRTEDPSGLGSAVRALSELEAGRGDDPALAQRRRALLLALLRAELGTAKAAMERAEQRLREAREAGIDPVLLRDVEQELARLRGAETAPPPPDATAPDDDEPVADELTHAASHERAL